MRGLRYPVEKLLELFASGTDIEEIIEDHPDLEHDDLLAALEFGALAPGQRQGGAARRCVKFVVDAQLPAKLSRLLAQAGHDSVHTSQLPEGNRIPRRHPR